MIRTFLSATTLSFFALSTHANDLLLDISNEVFSVRGDATHGSDGIIYSAAILATDDDEQLATLGLWTKGEFGRAENLRGGVGGKVYGAHTDGDSFFALAIGGHVEYYFTQIPELSLSTEFFYAPEITVSDDFENLSDFTFRINYQVFDNASVYTGLRRIALDYNEDEKLKLDNRIHAGIKINF
jgi:hypothetical protein